MLNNSRLTSCYSFVEGGEGGAMERTDGKAEEIIAGSNCSSSFVPMPAVSSTEKMWPGTAKIYAKPRILSLFDWYSRLMMVVVVVVLFALLPAGCQARPASEEDGYEKYHLAETNGTGGGEFKQISKEAFKALKSTDDQQQRTRWSERGKEGGRKGNGGGGQGKKKLPGRNQAIMIAKAEDESLFHATKCETREFKQRVKMKGCLSKVIVNRFCHGTCSSYWIPKPRAPLQYSFSCAQCRPVEYEVQEITLDCPERTPPLATRRIVEVKRCACRALDMTDC